MLSIEQVARICHETNRAYCQALGDFSQPNWLDAPDWQRDSAIHGVRENIGMLSLGKKMPPSASHDLWLAQKAAEGWTYGEVKDPEKKQHPCFVPYDDLPAEQKAKDYLFGAVVEALFKAGVIAHG